MADTTKSSNQLPSSYSSISNYDIGQQLGKGGFAIVYQGRYRYTPPSSPSIPPSISSTPSTLCRSSSSSRLSSAAIMAHLKDHNIAIKFINKSITREKDMTTRVHNEIRIHSLLNHSSIVKLFHWFEDENYYYLLLELCPHGTLFHYLKQIGPLNEKITAKYCYQILTALEYLQSHGVIHRDMKLSNLLLDENYDLKLCDFGLAVQLEHPDEEHFTICGTPNYIAPEIASQKSHGFPADIWSLGCLCYSMLTGGTLPFAHKGGVQETLKQIVAGEYSIPSHILISQSALSFLGLILHVDPFHRASVTQLMHHPFIVSNLSLDGKLPHNESQIPKSPQLHIQDSVSSHTVSTALQSYDAQSHNTNQTQERYISRTPEKDRRRHTPILENEEYYEKPKVNSPYGIMSDSPGTKTERLMPPKISKEPEINYEPNKSHPRRLESSNQLNDYVGRSSGHASVSHSVEYIPSPRQIDSSERPQGFRHSHDGVLSRNKRSLSHLAMITNQSVNSIRRSIDNESRSNNSLQRDLLQTYNSIDSVNGSILSLSLSSVGSSQRYRQASLDTSYSDHPMFSPQRASKFSTSSTISSLSPQSPDHHHKTNPTISSAPVLWTQRTPKQFVKNNSNQQNAKLSFCYSSPQGDVLAISSIGDVVYCTYLPDCTGRLRPCRLCVRSSQPLILSLGKVNHEMCQNIKSLTLKYGNQNYSSSDELLKQEGIYSSKSRISDDKICIFDDILWIKQYRITELDGRLKKVYYRVYDMIQMTKKRIPKLILYLTDTPRQVPLPGMRVHSSTNSALAAESDSTNNSVVCKCMLMSNVPFPDFYVRWSDGVKLHYSLSSGRLIVNRIMKESNENLTTSREIYRWDQQGMIDGTDWTISAPEDIKIYLLQAQKAMKRCILEEYGWNSNLTEPKVIIEDIENLR